MHVSPAEPGRVREQWYRSAARRRGAWRGGNLASTALSRVQTAFSTLPPLPFSTYTTYTDAYTTDHIHIHIHIYHTSHAHYTPCPSTSLSTLKPPTISPRTPPPHPPSGFHTYIYMQLHMHIHLCTYTQHKFSSFPLSLSSCSTQLVYSARAISLANIPPYSSAAVPLPPDAAPFSTGSGPDGVAPRAAPGGRPACYGVVSVLLGGRWQCRCWPVAAHGGARPLPAGSENKLQILQRN